jgi:hypothetical protein
VTLSILENGEIRQITGEVYLTMNGDTALTI